VPEEENVMKPAAGRPRGKPPAMHLFKKGYIHGACVWQVPEEENVMKPAAGRPCGKSPAMLHFHKCYVHGALLPGA
jgi:hypothetical protein